MFGEVETGGFDFRCRPQAHNSFDDVGNDSCAHDCQNQRNADGFDLFENQRLECFVCDIVLQICGQISIGGVSCQHSCEQRAHRAADRVNAKCIQRVVI